MQFQYPLQCVYAWLMRNAITYKLLFYALLNVERYRNAFVVKKCIFGRALLYY